MRRIMTAGALALLLAASGSAGAEEIPAVSFRTVHQAQHGLSVTATAEKGLYDPEEWVDLRVTVRNTSTTDVSFRLPASCHPGIFAVAVSPNGTREPMETTDGQKCPKVPAYKVLTPGESFEVLFFRRPQPGTVPGFYTVQVETLSQPPMAVRLFYRAGDFSDMAGHWADDMVRWAAREGLVSGYPDGSFRPEQSVTHAEFIKLVAESRGLRPFGSRTHWVSPWLNAGVRAGFVPTPELSPDKPITRLEMVTMLVRSAGAQQVTADNPGYPDVDGASRPFVAVAHALGITNGYPDGTFGPGRVATRADALTLIMRLHEYLAPRIDQGARVSVDGQTIDSKVIAATAHLPELVQAGPVAAAAGITMTEQADGSYHFSKGEDGMTVISGSPLAGARALGRPAARFDGQLYVPPEFFAAFGTSVTVAR